MITGDVAVGSSGSGLIYFSFNSTSNASASNAGDYFASPSSVNLVSISMRPARNDGWYNVTKTAPSAGQININFQQVGVNAQGTVPGTNISGAPHATISYTEFNSLATVYNVITKPLNITVPTTQKWTIQFDSSGVTWGAGNGNQNIQASVYMTGTFSP